MEDVVGLEDDPVDSMLERLGLGRLMDRFRDEGMGVDALQVIANDEDQMRAHRFLEQLGVDRMGDRILVLERAKTLRKRRVTVQGNTQNQAKRSRPSKQHTRLCVQPAEGDSFMVEVDPQETVGNLKAKIQDKCGTAAEQQRLFFQATGLEDGRMIADYSIPMECPVRMVCVPIELDEDAGKHSDNGAKVGSFPKAPKAPNNKIRIELKRIDGTKYPVIVNPSTAIEKIMLYLQSKMGCDMGRLRLICNGKQCEPDRSVADYEIEDGNVIFVLERLVGMISDFATRSGDDTVPYLLLDDKLRAKAPVPASALQAASARCHADTSKEPEFEANYTGLSANHRDVLSRFCRHIWDRHSSLSQCDLKATVPSKLMQQLLAGSHDASDAGAAVSRLLGLYRGTGAAKLVLRVTQGPTGACIPFHCDDASAQSTTQIALNDGYSGGRLCFWTRDRLMVLDRPAGSRTHHVPDMLHGVTALHAGMRKSLFVLAGSNGLGESGVVNVREEDLAGFVGDPVDGVTGI